jgi:hypothetical protein
VIGIAEACVFNPDDRLVRLLTTVIAESNEILRPEFTGQPAEQPLVSA